MILPEPTGRAQLEGKSFALWQFLRRTKLAYAKLNTGQLRVLPRPCMLLSCTGSLESALEIRG
jgi:hypothetical protein